MKNLKLLFSALFLCSLISCGSTRDLAKTLRYSDSRGFVGVDNINFQDLKKMKKGESCTWNLFFIFPVFGDGSIISAAENGDINNVQLIGETGKWYGGFISKYCTVVYGDNFDKKDSRQILKNKPNKL